MLTFKYQNNYVLAGITCVIYKVELDDFLELGFYKPLKKHITDLGVKYKKTSDSEWLYIKLLHDDDHITNFTVYNVDEENYCYCGGCDVFDGLRRVSPIILVIKNLDPQTSYDIKLVYVESGTEHEMHTVTTTTRAHSENKVDIGEVTVTGMSEDVYEEVKEKFTKRIQDAIDIINAVVNIKRTLNPTMQRMGAGIGADSGFNYMPSTNPDYWYTTATIHEFAHNHFKRRGVYPEMQVLELATNSPRAMSSDAGGHTFPEISPYMYPLPELYLIAILFSQ